MNRWFEKVNLRMSRWGGRFISFLFAYQSMLAHPVMEKGNFRLSVAQILSKTNNRHHRPHAMIAVYVKETSESLLEGSSASPQGLHESTTSAHDHLAGGWMQMQVAGLPEPRSSDWLRFARPWKLHGRTPKPQWKPAKNDSSF